MVRDVFRLAKKNAPAIIFIYVIDVVTAKLFEAQTGRRVQFICLAFDIVL